MNAVARLFPLIALSALGCADGTAVAPVTGVVTIGGEPLVDATINTQPLAASLGEPAGPGSYGKTDAEGRFVLRLVDDDRPGAVVGAHRVRIVKAALRYSEGREDAPEAVSNPLPRDAADGKLRLEVIADKENEVRFDL